MSWLPDWQINYRTDGALPDNIKRSTIVRVQGDDGVLRMANTANKIDWRHVALFQVWKDGDDRTL